MTPSDCNSYSYHHEGHGYTQNLFEIVHGRYVLKSNAHPRPLKFIILPFTNPLLNCINFSALLYKAIISGKSQASRDAQDCMSLLDIKVN
jgi:hypothetical protein